MNKGIPHHLFRTLSSLSNVSTVEIFPHLLLNLSININIWCSYTRNILKFYFLIICCSYINAVDFCTLGMCPAILLHSLISFNRLFLDFLEFFMCRGKFLNIYSSENQLRRDNVCNTYLTQDLYPKVWSIFTTT